MGNMPRTPEHKKKILSRVSAPDKESCWTWHGPMSATTNKPIYMFSGKNESYNVLIQQFMYQEANNVQLLPRKHFHYCEKSERCVNPLHNRPSDLCGCIKCVLNENAEKLHIKRTRIWIFQHSIPGRQPEAFVFLNKKHAEAYAQYFLEQRYGSDREAAKKRYGFIWSITESVTNPRVD